jgi:hypothetical protein
MSEPVAPQEPKEEKEDQDERYDPMGEYNSNVIDGITGVMDQEDEQEE